MKTLANILLMLSLSAPLFANNITPLSKLAENTTKQGFPAIHQSSNSALNNANTTPLFADATNPESKAEEPEKLPRLTVAGTSIEEITVTGEAEAYPGGQVTRSGRIGLLGNKDIFNTPFSISSYTAELIENQQARTVADVVGNDASASLGSTGWVEIITIRGFSVGSTDSKLYDGLPNLTSDRSTVQTLDRGGSRSSRDPMPCSTAYPVAWAASSTWSPSARQTPP